MVMTIKFSEMTAGGDLTTTSQTPGLSNGENVLFNNPAPNLAPGDTASRPDPIADPTVINRLRFNTEEQAWEYYNSGTWTQLL